MAKQSSESIFKSTLLKSDFKGIFTSEEEMLGAIYGILEFIGRYFKNEKSHSNDIFLTNIRVNFCTHAADVELNTGLFEDTLIINAPIFPRESSKQQLARRIYLLNHFIHPLQDSKLKTIIFLYTTLSPEVRKQLVTKYKKA